VNGEKVRHGRDDAFLARRQGHVGVAAGDVEVGRQQDLAAAADGEGLDR
jgi:hypothetical protein